MLWGIRILEAEVPHFGIRLRQPSFAVSSGGGGGGSSAVSGFIYRSAPTSAYRSFPTRPYRSYPIG